jgi:hypothetical protein
MGHAIFNEGVDRNTEQQEKGNGVDLAKYPSEGDRLQCLRSWNRSPPHRSRNVSIGAVLWQD